MSQQIKIIFGLDLVTALVLSLALTSVFAHRIRTRGWRNWHDISVAAWFATFCCWLMAMTGIAFGALVAQWLPLVLIGFSLGLIGFARLRSSLSHAPPGQEKENDGNQPAIIQFFCVTMLLLLCAVSLHFYIVKLG